MSTTLNLGRIMPINRGSYAGSTSYGVLDVVEHNGSSYWCKAACQGVEPPNASYWVLMASKGADGTNGQDGSDGIDAYQPFKGWFDSSSALSTNFPSPAVGDYAYVVGATSSDPVSVYKCSVAGTWADSGSEFNPANNQSFQTGQDLDQTKIVNDLTTGGANHVLSAEAGKTLKQGLDALGPKCNEAYNFLEISDVSSLPNASIKFGSIYLGNIVTDTKINLCDENYYYVEGGFITIHNANDITVRITEYDANKTYIKASAYSSQIAGNYALDSSTRFVRISAGYAARGFSSTNPVKVSDYVSGDFYITYTKSGVKEAVDITIPSIQEDIEILSNNASGFDVMDRFVWLDSSGINKNTGIIQEDTNPIACETYFDVDTYSFDGNLIFVSSSNNVYFFAIAFYDSTKTFLSRVGFVTTNHIAIPSGAAYFRISLVYKDIAGNIISAGVASAFDLNLLSLRKNRLSDIEKKVENIEIFSQYNLQELEYEILTSSIQVGQGICKMGNYLLIADKSNDSFDSGANNMGTIYIYDSSYTLVGTMQHNLGHASGISYSEKYDAFIMGNGNSGVYPRLDIMLNAAANVEAAIGGTVHQYLYGANDVMSIPLHTSSKELCENGDAGIWCFGGNDRIVIISVRKNGVRKFFKGILGVGSADFSDSGVADINRWGTFVLGKTNNEYNGTLKILDTYDGDEISSAQGMIYNKGGLIVTSTTSMFLVNKVHLGNGKYAVEERLVGSVYTSDGARTSVEPEDVVKIGNDEFLCSTTIGLAKFHF